SNEQLGFRAGQERREVTASDGGRHPHPGRYSRGGGAGPGTHSRSERKTHSDHFWGGRTAPQKGHCPPYVSALSIAAAMGTLTGARATEIEPERRDVVLP